MTRKFRTSTYLLAAIFLVAPLGAAADYQWTPWKTALSYTDARYAANDHAVQDCAEDNLSKSGVVYQDQEGMNWETMQWEYKSRHWYTCFQSGGWASDCEKCGFGDDCFRDVAAAEAMADARATCALSNRQFTFQHWRTQLGGPTTPSCPQEAHETGIPQGDGRWDQIYVSGLCE